jgi:hypothetical protein
MPKAATKEKPQDTPGFLVETWLLDKIIPYEKNARKISEAAVLKVAKSLEVYGWRQPMVVDKEGVMVVGHVRRMAALHLGWTEGPVHVATDLTPPQIKAYRLMDNRSNDEAKWDFETLSLEFSDLTALNFDLELTGFDLSELEPIMAADWTPETADGNLSDYQRNPKLSITFTEEQKQVVDSAIRSVRRDQEDDSITEGRALELICGDYLAGAK